MNDAVLNNLTHDFADVNSVRLHYVQAGSGDKLVLLLHGFPEFWYSWRFQFEALSRDFTVVAPDLRGYNLSDKPQQIADYKIDKLVADVTGLINYFNREKAFVVGHDWGAIIAWAVAQEHPEKVEKLVAMQVPPPAIWRKNITLRQLLASWYMLLFQVPALPEWFLALNDYAALERSLESLAAKSIFTNSDFAQYKKAWSQPTALTCAVNYYRANVFQRIFTNSNEDYSSRKIQVPTLFIYGEQEKAIVRDTVRNVKDFIDGPDSELRIGNAGHWVHQESANKVNTALLSFLES